MSFVGILTNEENLENVSKITSVLRARGYRPKVYEFAPRGLPDYSECELWIVLGGAQKYLEKWALTEKCNMIIVVRRWVTNFHKLLERYMAYEATDCFVRSIRLEEIAWALDEYEEWKASG